MYEFQITTAIIICNTIQFMSHRNNSFINSIRRNSGPVKLRLEHIFHYKFPKKKPYLRLNIYNVFRTIIFVIEL